MELQSQVSETLCGPKLSLESGRWVSVPRMLAPRWPDRSQGALGHDHRCQAQARSPPFETAEAAAGWRERDMGAESKAAPPPARAARLAESPVEGDGKAQGKGLRPQTRTGWATCGCALSPVWEGSCLKSALAVTLLHRLAFSRPSWGQRPGLCGRCWVLAP